MADCDKAEFWSGLNRLYEASVKLVEATEKLRETAESPEKRLDRVEFIQQVGRRERA